MYSFQSSKIEPLESMEKAFKKSLNNVTSSFEYPNPSGDSNLRKQVKQLHPHWTGDVLITNSATEATYLALSQVSGVIALNVPSYFGVIRQAKELGLTVVEWETVEELKKIKEFDAVLLTSNFTPPTGVSFSDKDKQVIGSIANDKDAIVIEDNAYEFLSYSEKPLTAIQANKVIRINSFSKLLTPSLRMGFLMAENDLFSAMRSKKITMNLSSSGLSQSVISGILEDQTLISEWQKELFSRYNSAKKAIKKYFNSDVEASEGGPFVKLSFDKHYNISALIGRAKNDGILLDNNENQYMNKETKPYIRLHLGSIKRTDIDEAIEKLSFII